MDYFVLIPHNLNSGSFYCSSKGGNYWSYELRAVLLSTLPSFFVKDLQEMHNHGSLYITGDKIQF